MKIGATRKFTFNVDSAIIANLNNALSFVAHVKVNNVIILKFKKGGGTGYDGDITIDGTTLTRAYIYINRANSLLLPAGKMTLETILTVTDAAYGSAGKAIVDEVEIDQVIKASTITE